MRVSFKCNNCNLKYTVRKKQANELCPRCGSSDLTVETSDYVVNNASLKKIIFLEILVIAILLILVLYRMTVRFKINGVEINKENCVIKVNASSPSGNRLLYSFDNGKTYQDINVLKVRESGVYMVVVKDAKDKKVAWDIPVVFSEKDIEQCGMPVTVPLQITGVEPSDETIQGSSDGWIRVSISGGQKPVQYSINGGIDFQIDSIFTNLPPGKYNVVIRDNSSQISIYQDPVVINPGMPMMVSEIASFPSPPTMQEVEDILNQLFADPDNGQIRDSLLVLFVNQTMNVDCELIGIPKGTPYQLFQFLQRRFEGEPGSKVIQVLDIGYDIRNRINKLKVKEVKVSDF